MMNKKQKYIRGFLILIAFPLLFIISIFIAGIFAGESITWPLNLPASLSATLGEIRGSYLHQGIDIKTEGRTGHPVYAPARGTLTRLVSKNRGYGNAVFLNHSNGRQTVYGHLDSFEEKKYQLNTMAKTLRVLLNQEDIDFNIKNNKFKYKKKMVIGYTGESGSGLPHLHFEVRKGKKYLNPLSLVKVEDKQPPVLENLYICYEQKNTTIHEKKFQTKMAGKIYEIPDSTLKTVKDDKLYFKLSCYDNVGAANKVAIYSITLYENNRIIFKKSFEEFNESDIGQGRLVYDISKSKINDGVSYSYFLCSRKDGKSKIRKRKNGYINLKKGWNEYKVAVSDYAGNTAWLKFRLSRDEEKKNYNVGFQEIKNSRRYNLNNKYKDLNVTVNPGSLYKQTLIKLGTSGSSWVFNSVKALSGVRKKDILKIVFIKPFDHVYKNDIKIKIKKPKTVSPKDSDNILIYRFFLGNKLKPLKTRYYPGTAHFEAYSRTNGYFVLLRDRVSPDIYLPPTHEFFQDTGFYRKIRFYTSENVSKIDAGSIECLIDGESFPCIYDKDRKWVEVKLLKESIKRDIHHVFVKVSDRAGNSGYFRDLLLFN